MEKRFWNKNRYTLKHRNLGRTFIFIQFILPARDRGKIYEDLESNEPTEVINSIETNLNSS